MQNLILPNVPVNFENRSIFDDILTKTWWLTFWTTLYISNCLLAIIAQFYFYTVFFHNEMCMCFGFVDHVTDEYA